MKERDLIDILSRGFTRAPEQLNDVHQADAEILRLGDDFWGITVDDFSAQEDLFEAAEPWLAGWNVVVATLSDLFSVGAVPRFFLPAVSLPPGVPEAFVSELSRGTREALAAASCFLIGGDVGQADPWRYVGTALGPIPSRRPVTRTMPPGTHTLWVSGPLGSANMAAAMGWAAPRFPLRQEVARIVREHAAACIDTSGGFGDALWNLGQATRRVRMDVEVASIPLIRETFGSSARSGLPREALLLGGAGEYELLFAIPESCAEGVTSQLDALGCRKVGRAEADPPLPGPPTPRPPAEQTVVSRKPSPDAAIRFIREDGSTSVMTEAPPCPRAAGSLEAHVREVVAMARALFGGGAA